jgi:dipeptidyl-peptidase 4
MKRLFFILSLLFCFSLFSAGQTMLERYQKAEQFLPKNISKLTRNVDIRVNPVAGSSDFWYKLQTEKGDKYYYFDGDSIKSKEAFDQMKLAASLSELLGKTINPDSLNLQRLTFKPKENKIVFRLDTLNLETD